MKCTQCGIEAPPGFVADANQPKPLCPYCNGALEETDGAAHAEGKVECPTCGTGWALTETELAQPTFTCSECGTEFPHEVAITADRGQRFDWRWFLPRSQSKWIFVVVMVAYNHALESFWTAIIDPFMPYRNTSGYYLANGWLYVIARVARAVVVDPVLETILLVGIIELFRVVRSPAIIQVLFATVALCCVDGFRWWPHGLEVVPGFALMSVAYLYWRPASWRNAFMIVVAIHGLYNATLDIRLVLDQVHSEIVSYQLTGNAFNHDRARSIYNVAIKLDDTGKDDEEIAELKEAIALYPYAPDYYLYLGVALRRKGELTDAEATLRKAISINPTYWLAWDDLSFVLYDQKRFPEAMAAANRALTTVPDNRRSQVEDMIKYIAPRVGGPSG